MKPYRRGCGYDSPVARDSGSGGTAAVFASVFVGLGTWSFGGWLSLEWPDLPSWVYLLIWTTSFTTVLLILTWRWFRVLLRRLSPFLSYFAEYVLPVLEVFLPQMRVLDVLRKDHPERRVQISIDEGESRLGGPGRWTLWLSLVVAVKQEKPAYIGSVTLAWNDKRECSQLSLKDWPSTVALPPHGPFPPLANDHDEPRQGYFAFDCGPVEDYEATSIFDGIFTLRLKFIDEPEWEYRCRALRWPEGTPDADRALQYRIEEAG